MKHRRVTTRARKYVQVYSALRRDIESGRWKAGDQLPSEAELVRTFRVSRITVTRAVRDLQVAGLVVRVAGSGTFVRRADAVSAESFGLLIPNLGETEIFEPICQGMMASPLARNHALLWGNTSTRENSKAEHALSLCHQYIGRAVSGVFFAPLEHTEGQDEVNHKVLRSLDEARIPVVLLDRPVIPYPKLSQHDLVGLDNRRAGYAITEHLLSLGCQRIAFVAVPNAAATIDARAAGYREAVYARTGHFEPAFLNRIDPDDIEAVKGLVDSLHPDGIVCANDRTAGRLMYALRQLNYKVPENIRLVGIDDVEYAGLLPVPLTTLRQPTHQIGDVALTLMLERIARPNLPPREVRLGFELVVRESCGSPHRVR